MITRLFAPSRGLVGLASFLVACASAGGMRAEPLDVGVLREFNGDYTTVLRATRNAVASAGLAVDSFEEVNDSTAMIVAKKREPQPGAGASSCASSCRNRPATGLQFVYSVGGRWRPTLQ